MDALLGSSQGYGAYRTLGNLTVAIEGVNDYTNYKRSLDLKTGVHTTTFESNDAEMSTSVFCSYLDEVCVYHISSTDKLPAITIGFENGLVEPELMTLNCGKGSLHLTGVTQVGLPEGLKYDAIARPLKTLGAKTECSNDSTLKLKPSQGQKSVTIIVGAGTNFDQSKGNAGNDFSFKGDDPAKYVELITSKAASKSYKNLLRGHVDDYQTLESAFSLNLPDVYGSEDKETSALISEYSVNGKGDPFLEALLFDYSRHLLITSSRPGSLPANLQGRWTEELGPAWSADYHTNINLQMNYWVADQTGLGETQDGLWDYMELNWVPRGTETARLLYDADGWVVHNELNIYGHTAMKEGASWANCMPPLFSTLHRRC